MDLEVQHSSVVEATPAAVPSVRWRRAKRWWQTSRSSSRTRGRAPAANAPKEWVWLEERHRQGTTGPSRQTDCRNHSLERRRPVSPAWSLHAACGGHLATRVRLNCQPPQAKGASRLGTLHDPPRRAALVHAEDGFFVGRCFALPWCTAASSGCLRCPPASWPTACCWPRPPRGSVRNEGQKQGSPVTRLGFHLNLPPGLD